MVDTVRRHGLSYPLHIAQIFLIILTVFTFAYLVILIVPSLTPATHIPMYVITVLLFSSYTFVTTRLMLTDPSSTVVNGAQIPCDLYCEICAKPTLLNSIHCKYCNKCVMDLDHHCFYYNTCIGSQNYSMFISSIVLGALYSLLVTTLTLYCSVKWETFDFMIGSLSSRSFLILNLCIGILTSIIACFQIWLICLHMYLRISDF